MANVINMGAGGASFVNGTVEAGCRVVYSDGFGVQDKTPTSEESISVLFNSLIYAPSGVKISPSTATGVDNLYLVTEDFNAAVGLSANFADNTWTQIIFACQTKQVPDTWAVGDQKTMTIDGHDYLIDIIGKNHDDYADGSGKAPLTFQLHELYYDKKVMTASSNSSASWDTCVMRTTHLPAILNLMPEEVKNAVKEVSKLSGHKYSSGNYTTTVADKLFILSRWEIIGDDGDYALDEFVDGTWYEYYQPYETNVIKTWRGSARAWVQRTPSHSPSTGFCTISPNGWQASCADGESIAFSFGFCF